MADQLAFHADWTSMTTRPTWAVIAARTGRSRATVARALATLREAGLLGVVATGRSAGYGPMALGGQAEAAVYVLAVPSPLRSVDEAGDEHETPTRVAGSNSPPGARESEANNDTEPLRGPISSAAARPNVLALRRQDPVWSGSATAKRKDERRSAALELQRRLPALRRTSAAWVAAATREFMLAGWTVNDIHHAIDRRPDGSMWPHDGATGVQQIGRWLSHRLHAWRDAHGTVRRSPSQRAAAEAVRARARAAARAAEHARTKVETARPDSPTVLAAKAQIRAALDAARQERRTYRTT